MMLKKKGTKIFILLLAAVFLFAGGLWAGTLVLVPEQSMNASEHVFTASTSMAYGTNEAAMDMGVEKLAMSTSGAADGADMDSRKLIRTADLTLRTPAFDDCTQTVQGLIEENGGYIESLYQYGETVRRLNLSARIPSDRLDGFLAALEGAGRVSDRSESTIDRTTQYQDNAARLETLYAKRDRLNELLAKAEDVSDLIEIESAIADTQYEIESYETAQRSIDRQVDMSEVSLSIVEESPADSAAADIPLGQRMRAALDASLTWLKDFLQNTVVFLVLIAPVAIPLAAIVLILLRIHKRKGK